MKWEMWTVEGGRWMGDRGGWWMKGGRCRMKVRGLKGERVREGGRGLRV